jgi:hypothetical protein
MVVGIATDYRVDGRGVGVPAPVEARFLFTSRRPDRFGANLTND